MPGPPVAFGNPFAPAGAGVALAKQTDNILTALAVEGDQRVHVAWVVGTEGWNGPVPI